MQSAWPALRETLRAVSEALALSGAHVPAIPVDRDRSSRLHEVERILCDALHADRVFALELSKAVPVDPARHLYLTGLILEPAYPYELAGLPRTCPTELEDVRTALQTQGVPPRRARDVVEKFQAGCCAWQPCIAFTNVWGVLAVHRAEAGRRFDENELRLLQAVSDCVGICAFVCRMPIRQGRHASVEIEHQLHDLQDKWRECCLAMQWRTKGEALIWALALGMRSKPLLAVLNDALGQVQQVFRVDSICVRSLDKACLVRQAGRVDPEDCTNLWAVLRGGGGPSQPWPCPHRSLPAGVRCRIRYLSRVGCATRVLRDWDEWDPDMDGEYDARAHEGIREFGRAMQFRTVVVRSTKRVFADPTIGLVKFGWAQPREIGRSELEQLERFADHICFMHEQEIRNLEAQRPHEEHTAELERQLKSEALLRDIASSIRTKLDVEAVLQENLGRVRELFQADFVRVHWFQRLDRPPREVFVTPADLRFTATSTEGVQVDAEPAVQPELPAALRYRLDRLFAQPGRVFSFRDVAARHEELDAGSPASFDEDREEVRAVIDSVGKGCKSGMVSATEWGGRPTGTVQVGWREERDATPHQRALFGAICDSIGHAIGQSGLLREIAAKNERLEALLEEAQQAARAKADFLSVVTHEMRTPMQAVLGIVSLLLETPLSSEQREHLLVAQASGQALVDLIAEVLEASALERGGRLGVNVGPFDLRACLEEAMDMLWPVAAQKGVSLQIRMGNDVPRFVASDRGRIRQVVINLCGNSIKFSEGGRILVDVEAEGFPCAPGPAPGPGAGPGAGPAAAGSKLLFRITVTDSGSGISEENLRLLFQFFTQLDSSKSRRHQGTGLGLYISLQIARALEGDIQVVSTPGTGSTFAFTFRAAALPEGDPALPALRAACLAEGDAVLRGAALVVAVDEAEWAGTATADAERWGMRPVRAATVDAVLEAVRREAGAGAGRLAGVLFYMPGLVPEQELPAVASRILAELAGASGGGEGGGALPPPPLLLLRTCVAVDSRLRGAGAVSLRLPVSERVLHEHLVNALRPPGAPAPGDAPVPRPSPLEAPARAETEAGDTNARIILMLLRRQGYGDVVHVEDGLWALRAAREAAAGPAPSTSSSPTS
eukprot:tig00020616_g12258.t1